VDFLAAERIDNFAEHEPGQHQPGQHRMEEREKERAILAAVRSEIDQVVADRRASKKVRLGIRARTEARRVARLLKATPIEIRQGIVTVQPPPVVPKSEPLVPAVAKPAFSMTSMRGPDPSRAAKLAQIAKASVGRL